MIEKGHSNAETHIELKGDKKMSKLTFWCDEETSEPSSSDSPYFLIYVGDAQKRSSTVKRLRREIWDDQIDKGESRSATMTFPEITSFDLVLIALLEEDWDADFDDSTLQKVRNWIDNLDSLLAVQSSDVFSIIKQEFERAINNFCSNDDLLGVRRFSSSGAIRHYFGGGGHYRVKFEV